MIRILIFLLFASPAVAVPVVPNFSQGVVSSHTESKTIVKESIVPSPIEVGLNIQSAALEWSPLAA